MGRFNVTSLRFLEPEHFRVLLAIEMGMKNHELVPLPLLSTVASIHRGAATRALADLTKLSLVAYERGKRYDGYRLTNLGYDFLALRALCARGVVAAVGNQIGVGKESDVYVAGDSKMNDVVLKLHRLGRTSFRKLKEKRDYHQRRHYCSWLYLSRIAALKEFTFLKALYARNFPVPRPIDVCRHTVVMGLVDGLTLCHVDRLQEPGRLYDRLMQIIVRLAAHGVIHGDINEFNVILLKNEEPIIIDFPQMVSIGHSNAEFYFDRDVECVRTFFRRRFHFEGAARLRLADVKRRHSLDVELAASGFTKRMQLDLNQAYDIGDFDAHKFDENNGNEDGVDEDTDEDNEETECGEESDENDSDETETKNNDPVEKQKMNKPFGERNMKMGLAYGKNRPSQAEQELLDDAEAERERRRLRRETRFNNWLENARTQLENTTLEEIRDECPDLMEMDAETAAKYQKAYEKVQLAVAKYDYGSESDNADKELANGGDESPASHPIGGDKRISKSRKNRRRIDSFEAGDAPKTAPRTRSVYSNGSTIAPDEIKRRILKEKGKVKKERLKAKGKQCAVNRTRRQNMNTIREHEGWDCY